MVGFAGFVAMGGFPRGWLSLDGLTFVMFLSRVSWTCLRLFEDSPNPVTGSFAVSAFPAEALSVALPVIGDLVTVGVGVVGRVCPLCCGFFFCGALVVALVGLRLCLAEFVVGLFFFIVLCVGPVAVCDGLWALSWTSFRTIFFDACVK